MAIWLDIILLYCLSCRTRNASKLADEESRPGQEKTVFPLSSCKVALFRLR